KLNKQGGNVIGVNLITYLLPFVTEDRVSLSDHGAANNVGKVSVKLDRGVAGTGEAPTSKDPNGHVEISPEFLAQDVSREFGCPKQRVQTMIHGHDFVDVVNAISIVEALLQFNQGKKVGPVTVDFVCAHEAEGRFATVITRGHEQVQG